MIAFSRRRAVLSALIGIGTHVVVFAAAYVASLVTPASGGGSQDLAAAASVLFLGEVVGGLACIITGAVRYRRGSNDVGLGLVGGWVLGLFLTIVLINLG